MEKLLVHIEPRGEYDGGSARLEPIMYPSLVDAQTDLELLYLYRSQALALMDKEIEALEIDLEKNEGRWNTNTMWEKRKEIRTKEEETKPHRSITFGGNKFEMDELGYYCRDKKIWIYDSRISELNAWFSSHFPNLK